MIIKKKKKSLYMVIVYYLLWLYIIINTCLYIYEASLLSYKIICYNFCEENLFPIGITLRKFIASYLLIDLIIKINDFLVCFNILLQLSLMNYLLLDSFFYTKDQ